MSAQYCHGWADIVVTLKSHVPLTDANGNMVYPVPYVLYVMLCVMSWCLKNGVVCDESGLRTT